VGRVETMPKSDELHMVIELWKETSVWTRESEFSNLLLFCVHAFTLEW
jgi:hypothetical protein